MRIVVPISKRFVECEEQHQAALDDRLRQLHNRVIIKAAKEDWPFLHRSSFAFIRQANWPAPRKLIQAL